MRHYVELDFVTETFRRFFLNQMKSIIITIVSCSSLVFRMDVELEFVLSSCSGRKASHNSFTYCMDKSDSNSGKKLTGGVRIRHEREKWPHLIGDRVIKET